MTRRQIGIFINGKQVARSIKSLRGERRRLRAEIDAGTLSEKEYLRAAKRVREINGILTTHRNQLKAVESSWKKLSKAGLDKFAALTLGAFAVDSIVAYGAELFKLGGQMELLANKAQTVFGDTLPQVTAVAEANAAAMGLTVTQYTNAAAATQDLLIPMGFQRQEATNLTLGLVDLSGALSEWTGVQIKSEEVARILGKALLGEREELKQLGISIQEADVKARLAEKGLERLTGQLLQQAKATATLELITEKSVDAQVAFANNANTIVRRTAAMQAKFAEIRANIASALIPIFERLIGAAEPFVDLITRFTRIPLVRKLEQEQEALNLLVTRITDANISQENRNKLISQLQTKYPDFLGNLDAEKVTNDQLADRLRAVNDQYIFKIALQKEDDKIQKVANRLANQQRNLAQKDIEIQQKLLRLNEEYQLGLDFTNKSLQERIDLTKEGLRTFQSEGGQVGLDLAALEATGRQVIEGRVDARKEELEQLKQTREEIRKNLAAELGIDENAPQPTTSNTDTGMDLEQAAQAEAARKEREKIAKKAAADRQRAAERERQQIEDQLQQLKEAQERFREEARVNALSEDEQAIERIRQRYTKELQLAKELEGKGIQEGTSRRMELLRLQEEEIERFRSNQAEERLNRELARTEAEEEALFQKQLELETAKQAAEKQIRDQLNQVLLDEQEQQLQQLEEQYAALTQLALQFGLNTTELTRAFEIQKDRIRENFAKKEVQRQENLKAIAIARSQAELSAFQELSAGLKELLSENEEASKGLFLFEKGLAAAEVIINLQKELASIAASNASLGPLAPAVIASLSTAAKVRSAIRLATIGATTIQGISQRKDGGYFNVTGKDDRRPYRARYIGTPASGMLPPYPVVLASEAGPEYFVSHKDLQNPKVLNHVRAIDNIRRQRLSQFVEGGSTAPLATASTFSSSSNTTDLNGLELVAERLAVSVDTLNDILSSGIMAIIGDDTIIQLRQREQKIVSASGGAL